MIFSKAFVVASSAGAAAHKAALKAAMTSRIAQLRMLPGNRLGIVLTAGNFAPWPIEVDSVWA